MGRSYLDAYSVPSQDLELGEPSCRIVRRVRHLSTYDQGMKHATLRSAVILVALISFAETADASAPEKKFKNCTELRKIYPYGVAKDAKSATGTKAVVNAKDYADNKNSDRDADGIACE